MLLKHRKTGAYFAACTYKLLESPYLGKMEKDCYYADLLTFENGEAKKIYWLYDGKFKANEIVEELLQKYLNYYEGDFEVIKELKGRA